MASLMEQKLAEPWLRGPIEGVDPSVLPVFFSFTQVREDLNKYVRELTPEQVWLNQDGATIGFHLRHIAGSVDRLTTYLMGDQLSAEQLEAMRHEWESGYGVDQLLRIVDDSFRRSEENLRTIDPSRLYESRKVGRKELPTTVLGLIVHLAEHTQRHLGQVITLAKMLRHSEPSGDPRGGRRA